MSRLSLVYDLTPSRPWLFSALSADSAMLSAQGIDLGPRDPAFCEIAPSHLSFWAHVPERAVPTPAVRGLLDETARMLEAGRHVLLLSWTPDPVAQQSLQRLLAKHPVLSRHEVRALFIVGRPVCMLEQRYRLPPLLISHREGREHVRLYGALPALIRNAEVCWGRDRVSLLANATELALTTPQQAVARGVLDFLGAAGDLSMAEAPVHPLSLRSRAGRRLYWTPTVRENAWPPLDTERFMATLREVDSRWEDEIVAPLAMRRALARSAEGSTAELEGMLGLAPGALACPERLAEEREAPADAPLDAERVHTFAAALPPELHAPLLARFANDRHLLTPDQTALAAALAGLSGSGSSGGRAGGRPGSTVPDAAMSGSATPGPAASGSAALGPDASPHFAHLGEPEPPVELTVLTMTCNQAGYIGQCLESVRTQQTSFPVRHLVLDHHSDDGTAAIVAAEAARHPTIRPVLLTRRRFTENVMGLFTRCRSKYAALCDGDDYFTDPRKLQRQVDFLERHQDCTLCFHPVGVVHENGDPPGVYPPPRMLSGGVRESYVLEDLFQGNFIQTNSVVYRWRFAAGVPDWFRPDLCPGDWYWHLLHAEQGRIGFLREIMSVYRRHASALFSTSIHSVLEHRRIHGMAELQTYHVVNAHFNNRYFDKLAGLANGVLANFLEISVSEGDDRLLREATELFPPFARHFLDSLARLSGERPAGKEGRPGAAGAAAGRRPAPGETHGRP